MKIKANNVIYDMELKKLDFESQAWGKKKKETFATNEEHTQKSAWEIKKFLDGSYDIRFLCSNMRIEANGEIYDMESKFDTLKLTERDIIEIANLWCKSGRHTQGRVSKSKSW